MSHGDDVIRASELGEWAYCARAWWLHRVQGVAPANVAQLAGGQTGHRRHGRGVERAWLLRRLALVVGLLSALALAAGLIWLVVG